MTIMYKDDPNGGTTFYQPGKEPLYLFGDAADELKKRSTPMSDREAAAKSMSGGPSVEQITTGLDRATAAGGMTEPTDRFTQTLRADASKRSRDMGKTPEQLDRERTVELGQSVGRLRDRLSEGHGDLSLYQEPDLDKLRRSPSGSGESGPETGSEADTIRSRIAELEQKLAQLEGK